MKKAFSIILACVILASILISCGKNPTKTDSSSQGAQATDLNGSIDFDEEDFYNFASEFPYYFSDPIASTDELKNQNIIKELMEITYNQSISTGYVFEEIGAQKNIIIPKEMILETAKQYFKINYDIDYFAEDCQFYDHENSKFILPSAFSGSLLDFEVLKQSITLDRNNISITINFYKFDTNREEKLKTLCYSFSIVDAKQGNIYQLNKIEEIKV